MKTPMKHYIDPTIDFVFKVLFASKGNEPIVIHFLNSVLQPATEITHVTIKNPYNDMTFDSEKLSVVDVKVEDQDHHTYQIEIQLTTPKHLRQRMLYNWSQIYSKQLGKGDSYNKLKPAISIWLLDGNLEKDDDYHHHYQLIDAKSCKILSDHCAIHLLELKKWHLPQHVEGKLSDEDVWPFFFTQAHRWLKLPSIANINIMERAMNVLEQISNKSEQYERYVARHRSQMEELTTQENLRSLANEKSLRLKAQMQADEQKSRADEQTWRADEQTLRADEQTLRADEQAKEIEALQRKIAMLETPNG